MSLLRVCALQPAGGGRQCSAKSIVPAHVGQQQGERVHGMWHRVFCCKVSQPTIRTPLPHTTCAERDSRAASVRAYSAGAGLGCVRGVSQRNAASCNRQQLARSSVHITSGFLLARTFASASTDAARRAAGVSPFAKTVVGGSATAAEACTSAFASGAAASGDLSAPRFPSAAECAMQARAYHEMSNEVLLLLAANGDHGARTERFVREVMHVDKLEWVDAAQTVADITLKVGDGGFNLWLGRALGLAASAAGFAVVPMIFDLGTALEFNAHYVSADVPVYKDLETALEVGAWTWNWMEPPLGTVSFILLCLQWARQQRASTDGPYTAFRKRRRAQALLRAYPQYNAMILRHWSDSLCSEESVDGDALHVLDSSQRRERLRRLSAGPAAASSAI